MKCLNNSIIAISLVVILAVYPVSVLAAAPPIRYSSDLGQESDVLSWNLFGPTNLVSYSDLNLKMSFQITCDNQSGSYVASSPNAPVDPADAGGCTGGAYRYIFQIPARTLGLEITFGNLANFTFTDNPNGSSSVGVLECDSSNPLQPTPPNTAVLCTTLAPSGAASELPTITFTQPSATEVTVTISSIPSYPAATGCLSYQNGGTMACLQGQGLTLFLETNTSAQGTNVPISFPTVVRRW